LWEDLVYARSSLKGHKTNESIRQEVNVRNVVGLIRRGRLQWVAHKCRRDKGDDIKRLHVMKVRKKNPGHPKHRWQEKIRKEYHVPSTKRMLRTVLGGEARPLAAPRKPNKT